MFARLRDGPLAARQAARLVQQVAEAVQYAHEHGVIHRDLKPANVMLQAGAARSGSDSGTGILQKNEPSTPRPAASHATARPSDVSSLRSVSRLQPKITDFGLAKRVESDSDLTASGQVVGTPSYMPPEQASGKLDAVGPVSDVYALGAILYACLTGRPPFQADNPVDTLIQVLEREPVAPRQLKPGTPRDLETICLKCLEKDARHRYATAQELADDLGRYVSDEPILARPANAVERGWRWCRRNPLVATLTTLAVVFLLAGIAVSSGFAILADQRADEARSARDEATERLWESYLTQARAQRWSGRAGQRFKSLDAVAQAAAIRPSLDLRNAAVAAMALADLRVVKTWVPESPSIVAVSFDPHYQFIACADEHGVIRVFRATDATEVTRLRVTARVARLQFGPDGKYLMAKYDDEATSGVRVWDLADGKVVLEASIGRDGHAVDFSPDSRQLAVADQDGSIHLYELPSGKHLRKLTKMGTLRALRFNPSGTRLAVSAARTPYVWIRELDTGKLVHALGHPARVLGIAWNPDGSLLATACYDSHVFIWHCGDRQKLHCILTGHHNAVITVMFSHSGRLLASSSWDGTTRLWDALEHRQLVSIPGLTSARFSPDDASLGHVIGSRKIGIWQVATGAECRTLHPDDRRFRTGLRGAAISPGGRVVAGATESGVQLWDLATGQRRAFLPTADTYSVVFAPSGKELITSGDAGVQRWPIRGDPARQDRLVIGPPLRVAAIAAPCGCAELSRAGNRLVVVHDEQAVLVDLDAADTAVDLHRHSQLSKIAVSPDGRWVATATWQGSGIKVSDTRSRKPATTFLPTCHSASVGFSNDGSWLWIGTGTEYRRWRVGSWQPDLRIAREGAGTTPGPMAFTRDGTMMAIAHLRTVVRLVDPDTGRQLATLEPPEPRELRCLCFSSDGTHLAAVSKHGVQLWDLERIRRGLAAMGLDWQPPAPETPTPKNTAKSLSITVLLEAAIDRL